METKTMARIGAAAFVGVVLTATALQMRDTPPPPTEIITFDEEGADPLAAKLQRCQLLGAAGAIDALCLRAWAENRSRFFMSDAQASEQLVDDVATTPPRIDTGSVKGNRDDAAEPKITPSLDRNR
jgi:conjugative transfer region protein TrbK